jgi:hypothetical protein
MCNIGQHGQLFLGPAVQTFNIKGKTLHHRFLTMTIQSPINEMFGYELEYIQRGLSQLDLILNAKDRRIADLDLQLLTATKENARLQDEISKLRKIVSKYENSDKASKTSNLEQEVIDKFFESL